MKPDNVPRDIVARAISIVGHPVVLVVIAALVTASARGATVAQLRLVGGVLAMLGIVVLGYSGGRYTAGAGPTSTQALRRSARRSMCSL